MACALVNATFLPSGETATWSAAASPVASCTGVPHACVAGSTPIGGYLTGLMAEAFGVSAAIAINAAICLLGVAAGALYYTRHRQAFPEAQALT